VDEQKSSGSFLEELTQMPYQETQAVESSVAAETADFPASELAEAKTSSPVKIHAPKAQLFKSKKFSEPLSFTQTEGASLSPKGRSMYSFDEKKKTPVQAKVKQVDLEARRMEESIVKAPNAAQSLLKVNN